ncbi:MAG: heavy metal translocating P-type ATPase, partial [Pseudomonadota bacterium]
MACPCAVATRPTPKSSYDTEEERLRNASTVVDENRLRTIFLIPDMHCIACVRRIETRLSQLEFVVEARANLTQKTVRADWRPRGGMARTISEALDQEGFSATVLHSDNDASTTMSNSYQRLLSCVAVAGFAAANVMLLSVSVWSGASGETRDLFHLISGLIAIPAAAYAGRPFFNSAMAALRNWRLNMDVPISLAIVLALAMSLAESLRGGEEAYFDAALMLLFFLLIGRTLDALMRDRARRAIDVLSKIAAKGAVRLSQEGKHEFVDVGVLQPGDHVFLAAGERVPTDGLVRSDEGGVLDRSLVTGESEHVRVDKGEEVEAGTLNMAGPMEIEVTRTADESFLGEVAQMMAAAESGRSRFIRIADRVAGYYAPVVHLLALIAFVGWMIA